MRAFPCKSMVYFERGWCTTADQIIPSMGFNSYKSKGLTSGKFFLLTNARSPFCGIFIFFLLIMKYFDCPYRVSMLDAVDVMVHVFQLGQFSCVPYRVLWLDSR